MKTAPCLLLLSLLLACTTAQSPIPTAPGAPAVEEKPAAPAVVRVALSKEGLDREGLWRENMALADVNNDGFIDWVTPPTRGESERPHVFLGDGAGRWMEWADTRFPRLPFAYGGVAVGDIDQNGRQDIVLACHEGRIYALFQTEPGVFESRSDGLPAPEAFTSKAVKLADLTGDGRPELIALSETPTFLNGTTLNLDRQKVFAFDGGAWAPLPIVAEKGETMAFGNGLAVADFDLDGRLDFATVSSMFNFKRTVFANLADGFHPVEIPAIPDRAYLFFVDTADFDGNGRPDLVYTAMGFPLSQEPGEGAISAAESKVFVLLNLPDRWEYVELDSADVSKSKLRFRGLAAADFDGNGRPDVATVWDDFSLRIYLNGGDGAFRRATVEGWVPQGRASWLGSADLNADGRPDLAVAYGTEKDGGWLHAYLVKAE